MINQTTSDNLKVRVYADRDTMGLDAADMLTDKIKELLARQDFVNIIFAAAPSQNELLWHFRVKDIPWSRINAFHMDEYVGLNDNAQQRFGNFLKHILFEHVPFRSVHYLNGNAEDLNSECERYGDLLKEFPADIVCMGIGENGHLAFNDPPVADFKDVQRVKLVELDSACRQQQVNDGCFVNIDEVPTHALTLTIPALMAGRYIYCVVPGKTKKQAVYNTLKQDVAERYPSTILRQHPNAILFLDKDSVELTGLLA